jgi:hypothetical protein
MWVNIEGGMEDACSRGRGRGPWELFGMRTGLSWGGWVVGSVGGDYGEGDDGGLGC